MNNKRNAVKNLGLCFIALAIFVFFASLIVCVLIQSGFLGIVPNVVGGIAYFGGPLPIIPALLLLPGILFLGASLFIK